MHVITGFCVALCLAAVIIGLALSGHLMVALLAFLTGPWVVLLSIGIVKALDRT